MHTCSVLQTCQNCKRKAHYSSFHKTKVCLSCRSPTNSVSKNLARLSRQAYRSWKIRNTRFTRQILQLYLQHYHKWWPHLDTENAIVAPIDINQLESKFTLISKNQKNVELTPREKKIAKKAAEWIYSLASTLDC